MRLLLTALATGLLMLAGCPDDVAKADEKRKEMVEEVGGAAKRTIDNTAKTVNTKIDKGVADIEKAVEEADKDAKAGGGW